MATMIPFLGIKLPDQKNTDGFGGKEFLVQKVSDDLADSLEKSSNNLNEAEEKLQIPLGFRIVRSVCGYGSLLIAGSLIRALSRNGELTIAAAYNNAPGLFWVLGAALVIWGVLAIWGKRKFSTVSETGEAEYAVSSVERIIDSIFQELQVPETAPTVDILRFAYKEKEGKIKATTVGMALTPYENFAFRIHRDEENLYLSNVEGRYAFPINSLRCIRRVDKKISIPDWGKDEEPNKGIYKQYKMTVDQYNCIHFKPYYILEMEITGQIYGIYFPCYEVEMFEKTTNLKSTK